MHRHRPLCNRLLAARSFVINKQQWANIFHCAAVSLHSLYSRWFCTCPLAMLPLLRTKPSWPGLRLHTSTNTATQKWCALRHCLGTIFSHDKLVDTRHKCQSNPLKMACGCPCGGVLQTVTHAILSPKGMHSVL